MKNVVKNLVLWAVLLTSLGFGVILFKVLEVPSYTYLAWSIMGGMLSYLLHVRTQGRLDL